MKKDSFYRQTAGTSRRDPSTSLGKFELECISVDGVMGSDNSMTANVSLSQCILDDSRPGRESGITR